MKIRIDRAVAAALVLAVAAACGKSAPPTSETVTAVPDGPIRLADGLTKLAARLPESRPDPSDLFAEARRLFDLALWKPAAEHFAVFVLRNPRDPQSVHAIHFLGLAQEKLDDIEGTIEAFEYQLANYPTADEESTCEALFKTAESHYRQGKSAEAEIQWRRIMANHPRSRWAGWARERVLTLAKLRPSGKICCGDSIPTAPPGGLPEDVKERLRARGAL